MQSLDVFVRRPVMAIAINLVLLISGMVSYYHLELRHTSKPLPNEFVISTVYPGASSAAVEHQVTKPIEDALAGLDGVKKISSESQDSRSNISVKFNYSVSHDKALGQLRDRLLSTLPTLPEAVKRPEIQEKEDQGTGILYMKFEDKTRSIAALSDYVHRVVEERLRLVEGIASVGRFGNKLYMISVRPDPAALMEHGITVKDIVDTLKKEKGFASGGEIEGATAKESVVLSAMIEKPEDFANMTIKMGADGRVSIAEVASVVVADKPTFLKIRDNGEYIIGLEVIAKPQANPLEVSSRVHAFVDDLKKTMPASMDVVITFDRTKPFSAAFEEIRDTLIEATILVGLVVVLSLGSVRTALLPVITIPLCLIGTFTLMWLLNFSINPVTLLALVLAVGLVVDDAIVVVENIHRHQERGLSAFQAAKHSMKEISFAVVVMTLTLSAVYIPLIFQADESALMFREFAWTLAGSVLISGCVALTLTPALGGKFLKDPTPTLFWEKLSETYRRWLAIALHFPNRIGLLLLVVGIVGIYGFQKLPAELIPVEDEGYISGNISSDNAVAENVREDWFKKVETILAAVPEQERILTGVWQDQWIWWTLILKPSKERSRNTQEIIETLKPKLDKIVGPLVMVMDDQGFSGEEGLKVVVQYVGNQSVLIDALQNIMAEARKLPGFTGLNSEQAWEKPRLKVIVDKELAAELGVSMEAIEDTLYTFLSGRKATDFNFQGIDYDVEVRAPLELRSEIDNLNSYFVASAEKQWVPLGSLVTLKEILEPVQIKHYERMRGGAIQVALEPGMALDKAIETLEPIIKKHLPKDARYYFGGKAEQYRESKIAMWINFGLALAFIYLILAALFESFIHPLVVLLTVPLSITGAVWAVYWVGGTNNMFTAIGLVTLIGLITKHGILIVDFANRVRSEYNTLEDAVLSAAESRLRPVLMTTLAMVFGAIPLMFSVGAGAIARKNIGAVIIGGMLLGTLFSLFVVPAAYLWVAKRQLKKHAD